MEVANDDAINEKSFSFAEVWAAGSTSSLFDNNNNNNNNSSNKNNSFPKNRRYTRSIGNGIEVVSDSISQDEALLELLTREERAERGLITAIERRQSHVRTASGEVWVSAMEGECPPLGDSVPFERLYQQVVEPSGHRSAPPRPPLMSQSMASRSPVIRRPTRLTTRSVTDNNIPKTNSVQFDEKSTNSTASVDEKRKAHVAARQLRMRNLVNGSMRRDHVSPIQNNLTASLPPTHPSVGVTPPARWHRRNSSRAHFVLDSIQEKELSLLGQVPNCTGVANPSLNQTVDKPANNDKLLLPKNSRPAGLHRKSLSIGMTERDQLLVDTIVDPDEREIISNNKYDDDDDNDDNNGLVLPSLKQDEEGNSNDDLKISESKDTSISFPTKESQIELGETAPLLDERRKVVLMTQPSFPDSTTGDNTNLSVSDLTPTKMGASFYRKKRKQQSKFQKLKSFLFLCCHPVFLLQLFYQTFRESYFFLASLPLFITALILYYGLGNPTFYFLPGDATMAWWLNFIGRQLITLELARLVQYVLVDQIILQTRVAVQFLGPFITLLCIQARGWPFILLTWGILDLFLLHGNHKFQLHWLYFTNIRFYVDGNSGSYILTSNLYLRILLSMIVAGFACTIKRSLVAVAFGRRTFATFKPRLESILKEVILLSEVAELAEEADGAANAAYQFPTSGTSSRVNILGSDLNWTRDRFFSRDGGVKLDAQGDEDDLTENSGGSGDNEDDISVGNAFVPNQLQESSIRCLRVKDLLEKWEEPVNKMDKSFDTSIRDILKFRRALTFIDDSSPFGDAFGPASSRDQVLVSAEMVYHRLLKLCPECTNLSYDIFDMLIDEDDGKNVNHAKKKALKRIFRPDANNEISMLAFLQSCDSLYKKLRFFRASVGNASVIDKALERMLNGIFYFILTLTCLSIMRINPWPLLVSISTLLVSVSFAVGSSASKYIEGVILIAGRRPYDLGDRIYMVDSSNIHADAIASSWFIEDINLSFTTVRYSGTNEVATLSNGAIAGLRIVNANRSPNALIGFELPFHISIAADKEKLTALRSALDKYARDFPNHWKCFVLCRVNAVHIEIEQAILFFSFQHQSSWQDVSRILLAKADLICFIYELGKSFGINYDELPKRELLYYAGVLKEGVPKSYRRDLTTSENMKGSSDDSQIRPADSFLTNLKQTFR